ncbi:Alpha-type protein kinase domain-containing protein [Mycena kentingensis (nom. inval.)]|nr:Alpha-type protein kinase domain-containing protein [Mycena kentingensis (nom. inval.)]
MPVIHNIQTCGASECIALAEAEKEDPQEVATRGAPVPDTYSERTVKTMHRFKASAQPGKLLTPGTTLHTAALVHHGNGRTDPKEEFIRVAIVPHIGGAAKSTDSKIGVILKGYGVSTPMPDILQETLNVVNPQFIQHNLGTIPLNLPEVSFRFAGSRLPIANTLSGSLGNFFARHSSTSDDVETYINHRPAAFKNMAKGGKGKAICLEFYVNMDMYKLRVEGPAASAGSTRKRSASNSVPLKSVLAKRGRSSLPGGLCSAPSAVTFKKLTVSVDPVELTPDVILSPEPFSGLLYPEHFTQGSMKLVHELIITHEDLMEERVVAKRLFRVSENDADDIGNKVPLDANRDNLEAEVYRLVLGEKILGEFYTFSRAQNAEVFRYLKFSSAYLATELQVSETRAPSVASGMKHFPVDSTEGMTWLIEPKRASAVINFTGTLDHASHAAANDIQAKTVHAFTHFVFAKTERSLVFADLQGTPGPVRETIYFSGSGLGDWGQDGINSFVEGHSCNDICAALGLDKQYPMVPGEEDLPEENDTTSESTGLGERDEESD